MSKHKTVYIVQQDSLIRRMFHNNGWLVVNDPLAADLVQFTGGEDVSPYLYDEEEHSYTNCNPRRDTEEAAIFKMCLGAGTPMAGVCRGGQFLNVMSGGKMWQHVDHHAIQGTHVAIDLRTGKMVPVTSTHHQMMRPGPAANVIGVASESSFYEHMEFGVRRVTPVRGEDIEVLQYPGNRTLCFQPHPEHLEVDHPCQKWYFTLLDELLESA